MDTIAIDHPRYDRTERTRRLSSGIRVGGARYDVYFQTDGAPIATGAEPFLAVALLPAMRLGLGVQVGGSVSLRLLEQLPVLQARFASADPQLRIVGIDAVPAPDVPSGPSGRVGAFFSGGVDSFSLLLTLGHEITDLVFVHGFDIDVRDEALHGSALEMARNVARETGKRLLLVETNLRRFTDRYADWAKHTHGPALAAVAHTLSPHFTRVLIPGEYVGSTPLVASRAELDGLWSTERVEIAHRGSEMTRFQKLARIGADPLARRWLRVCWENQEGRYNCCRCSKCLRNMAGLRALGMLQDVRPFSHPLDLGMLSRLRLPPDQPHLAESVREMLNFVERRGADPELARALRHCVSGRYHRGIWRVARVAKRALGRFAIRPHTGRTR
jgi:hypothetical protein